MKLQALIILAVCHAALATEPLDSLVKAPKLAEGWVRDGEPQTYDRDSVFKLIDGEAEAYFPYGFQKVVAVSYTQEGNPATLVAAEVYEMGSVLDAFGIYSSNRQADSKLLDIGTQGYGDESQVTFYQEKYFLKVRADKPEGGKLLLGCCRALSQMLGGEKKPPQELALVQIPSLKPQTDQYIAQSLLGYEFWPKGFGAEAQVGENTARIFVVIYDSPDAAGKSIAAYEDYLKQNKQELKRTEKDGATVLIARDPLYEDVALQQIGKYVIGAAKISNPEQGLALLASLRQQVPKQENK